MSKQKDKRKGIQKAEDYQLVSHGGTFQDVKVPVQNKFQSLTNFPPLPYKAAVRNFFPNQYHVKFTEHLFLTNHTLPPTNDLIRPYIQNCFGNLHYLTNHPQKDRRFYELILVDSHSINLTHTKDKTNPDYVLYSKCIIRHVIGFQEWKNPFDERRFSIPYQPQTYNYNDYKMAWYRAFLYKPDVHSWFFNFHDTCSISFPVWFYHWWIHFGGTASILPNDAKEGWDLWFKVSSVDHYRKEVQFFRTFNVAWIFSWEYRFQKFLQNPFPLSMVRIYKVRWWPEFKTILCCKENVEHFLKTRTKEFTLFNLKQAELSRQKKEDSSSFVPPTPAKKESSFTTKDSQRTRSKGLSQKQRDLLEILKDEPELRKNYLQKLMAQDNSVSEDNATSMAFSSHPDPYGGPCSQDPFDI